MKDSTKSLMTEKKDILFVMNNLNVGGAEKALVSMLQVFDYDRYNVDLLLFKKEGLFLKQVPPQVNILEEPENYRYFDMPFSRVVKENLFNGKWNNILRRIQYKLAVSKAQSPAEAEQFGWKPLSKTLKPLKKEYDVAIGFLEKNPVYFVVDKVIAEKKIAYIHNDYNQLQLNKDFDMFYFYKLDHIVTVSLNCLDVLKTLFPQYQERFHLIYNIISEAAIRKLVSESDVVLREGFNIISVGRLEYQKGYDLAYESVKQIMCKFPHVTWYILGEGSQRKSLSAKIKEDGLDNKIFLIGAKENPYPYIAAGDLFLHTARFEGYGIVVTEAKILQKPIVVTDFNTAHSLIEPNVTGLISQMNASAISYEIERLIVTEDLRSELTNNLKLRNFGTEDEIEKFYQLIES